MIPTNGSSLGRAGGLLRRYPGGTENASIFATVRGSSPNRRAASRRLIPSTYTARRTCPYSSPRFIPPPTSAAPRQMGYCCRIFTPVQPVYPAASNEGFSLRCLQYDTVFEKLVGGAIDNECIYTIAGFAAYVICCSPA